MYRRYTTPTRYSQQKKTAYLALCRRYNSVIVNFEQNKAEFIRLSLQIHQLKGDVPVKWRTDAFITRCGITS